MTGDQGTISFLTRGQALEVCARNNISNSFGFWIQNFRIEFSTGDHAFDGALGDVANPCGLGCGYVVGWCHVSNIRQAAGDVKGWHGIDLRSPCPKAGRGSGGWVRLRS